MPAITVSIRVSRDAFEEALGDETAERDLTSIVANDARRVAAACTAGFFSTLHDADDPTALLDASEQDGVALHAGVDRA